MELVFAELTFKISLTSYFFMALDLSRKEKFDERCLPFLRQSIRFLPRTVTSPWTISTLLAESGVSCDAIQLTMTDFDTSR